MLTSSTERGFLELKTSQHTVQREGAGLARGVFSMQGLFNNLKAPVALAY